MPVDVLWEPDPALIRQIISDPWSWDEFIAVRPALRRYLDQSERDVIILIDVRTRQLPSNVLSKYNQLSDTDLFTHPRMAGFVIVSPSRFIQVLGDLFKRVYPSEGLKMRVVSSEDGLAEIITQMRAEINA